MQSVGESLNPVVTTLVSWVQSISCITNSDYVEIVSTFMTMTNPNYRCFDCKKRYKYEPDRRQKLESGMACKGVVDRDVHKYNPTHSNNGNPKIIYSSGVGNYYFGEWTVIINSYERWEKGIFPFIGGFLDQPSKYVDVMNLVASLIEEDKTNKDQMLNRARKLSGKK